MSDYEEHDEDEYEPWEDMPPEEDAAPWEEEL